MAYIGSEFFEEGYAEQIASLMKVSKYLVIGHLVVLWHITQKRGVVFCTEQEIDCWSGNPRSRSSVSWVRALMAARLVNHSEDCARRGALYEIAGNKKRIEGLNARKLRAKSAVESRWKRYSENTPRILQEQHNDTQAIRFDTNDNDNDNDNELKNTLSSKPPFCGECADAALAENQFDGPPPEILESEQVFDKPKRASIDCYAYVSAWNQNRGSLRACTKLTTKRRQHIKARSSDLTPEQLGQLAARLAKSSFALSGSWATFDWLVSSDTNCAKVAEGNYDDKPSEEKKPVVRRRKRMIGGRVIDGEDNA